MALSFLLSFIVSVCSMWATLAQDSICVKYDIQNITVCKDASTWAEGTPNLTIVHKINPAPNPPFNIEYDFFLKNSSRSRVCLFQFVGSSCNVLDGDNCNCPSDKSVGGEMIIYNMGPEKQESTLRYDTTRSSVKDIIIHTFSLAGCSKTVGEANATIARTQQCGYDCVTNFTCASGSVDPPGMYSCSAAAKWSPMDPTCVAEPTTTETTTAPTAPTASHGSAQDANATHYPTTGSTTTGSVVEFFPNSGAIFAALGGVLAAVCFGLFVYMASNGIDISNKVTLYAMSMLCLLVWAIALGLCFGMSTNEAAVIAGIVLGTFALAGMVVVMGFQISLIKSHEGNGIPGKPEDSSL